MEGREEDGRRGGEEEAECGTKRSQEKTNCCLESVVTVVMIAKEEAERKEEGEGEKWEGG